MDKPSEGAVVGITTPEGKRVTIGYDFGEELDTAVVIEHNEDGTMTIVKEVQRETK